VALARTNVSTTTKAPGAPTSFTSAAFTPADNSLVTVFGALQSSDQALLPSISGGGLTWTKQLSAGPDAGAAGHFSVLWTAPVTTGASMTVTIGNMPSDGTAEGVMHIFTYTGYNTSTPIGATATGLAGFNNPVNLTLSAAPATTSEVIACASDDTGGGAPAITAGTGWSEQFHVSDGSNTDSQSQTRTASTSTNVLWNGNAAGSNGCAVAMEIQAAAAGVVENYAFFKGRTFPSQWNLNAALLRGVAQDTSSFGIETNPHWRGRTWAPQWSLLRALMQNSDPNAPLAQPETNTFFIPRAWPLQWKPLPLGRTTAQDFSSFGVETNPHWAGRAWPAIWQPLAALGRVPAIDVPFVQPDTPAYFTLRVWPLQWNINKAIRQVTAQDFSAFGVETNVQFISRTWPAQWNLQASLMRGAPQDFSTLPPATQPVYARYGASHGIGALSAIPGEIPS